MMDTKLTLNVDKIITEQAKEYAKSHNISLSKLIESYLASLVTVTSREDEITALVKSLSGVITLDNDFDYKEHYADYVMDKYKCIGF